MNKLKVVFIISLLFIVANIVYATTSNFQAITDVIVSNVSYEQGMADLLIMEGSEAESFKYDNGVFSVTNPSSENLFKVGSLDAKAKAIRLLNTEFELVDCIKNNSLGEDYIELPSDSGTYFLEPSDINLANSLTYNSQCGASSCVSGYRVSGSGSSAICSRITSGGGGGGVPITYCTSVEYDDWGDCINGFQNRSIIDRIPSGCTLTTEQQLAQTRECVIEDEELKDKEEKEKEQQESEETDTVKGGDELKKEVLRRERDNQAVEANIALTSRLSGRILLQVEEKGEAWYLSSEDNKRHYLGRPKDAFSVMRGQGVGITNENLARIPVSLDYLSGKDTSGDGLPDAFKEALGLDINSTDSDGDGYCDYTELLHGYNPLGPGRLNYDLDFASFHSGRIFLQVEQNGEAWYVSPDNNKRYFLGRPDDAFNIMRELALGITNENLRHIPLNLDELELN